MKKIKTNPKLDQLMEETVVVRAVDDGDGVILQAPIDDVKGPYEPKVDFQHWAQGDMESLKGGLKTRLRLIQNEVVDKVHTVQTKVKANPYIYALGAIGAGFILGRIFMSQRKTSAKLDLSNFQDSPREHTGVHIRRESRFASQS